jgi:alkylresorcinol/alkylpyrone synthase
MPRIIEIAAVVPEYAIAQSAVADFVHGLFANSFRDIERLLPIFENTEIEKRYSCVPLEWFKSNHSFHEKNRLYIENAIKLSEKAVRKLVVRAAVRPEEIDHVFFVSTTGIATPSIDAHLFNRLEFSPFIRRTPIWGLGCGGGIAGLARAADWLKAYPRRMALVVAVELCSLTFIRDDISKSNFVATSLFGDGAAAVLLGGDECPLTRPRMIEVTASGVMNWKDSLAVMGWEVNQDGLKVLFSKDIPAIVHQSAKPAIIDFLAQHGLTLSRLSAFPSHPGGAKVIRAYEAALELSAEKTRHMWRVLKKFGNMSSATVLFVLKEFLRSGDYKPGEKILSCSLGPGFTSEMILGTCL